MLFLWSFITLAWSICSVWSYFTLTVFDGKRKSIGYVGIAKEGHLHIVYMKQSKAKFRHSDASSLEVFDGKQYVSVTTDQSKALQIDVATSQSQQMMWQEFGYQVGHQNNLMQLSPLNQASGSLGDPPSESATADPIVYTGPKLASEARPRVYVDLKTPVSCSRIHLIKNEAN